MSEDGTLPKPPKAPKKPRKGSIAFAAWEADKAANPRPLMPSLISTLVCPEFDEWGFPVWPKERRGYDGLTNGAGGV